MGGLIALGLAIVIATLLVPHGGFASVNEPTTQGIHATFLTTAIVLLLRVRQALRLERWVFAVFLACMPLIYVSSWVLHGRGGPGLTVELVGFGLFAVIAIAGALSSAWLLPAGIVAHGVLWDLWHLGRTPYMPDWYAIACAVIDVGTGMYVATRIRDWRQAELLRKP